MAVFNGTNSADYYSGTSSADTIYGNGGNDQLYGNGGNDSVYGGAGNDSTFGGDGDDLLEGGSGSDTLNGGAGDDTMYGSGGNDAANRLSGLGGDDYIYGGRGADTINGGAGSDHLHGDLGNDLIVGGGGADALSGNEGTDTLVGGAGDDVYWLGDDRLGAGGDVIVEAAGGGTDTVRTSFGITLPSELENVELRGVDDQESVTVYGNASANVLNANGFSAALYGLDGNDSLRGEDNATLVGGSGDDVYTVSAGRAASIIEGENSGTDAMIVFIGYYGDTYTLVDNVEDIKINDYGYSNGTYTYYVDSFVIGNARNNRIQGGDADNDLDGAGGADTIYGGDGDDTLDGGAGTDYLDGGAGSDTVDYGANTTPVKIDLVAGKASFIGKTWAPETLVAIENAFGGSANDVFIGNASDNDFHGNAGNDSFTGGNSSDEMYGGAGNDTFDGGGGTDYVEGGAGTDTLVYASNTSSVSVDLAGGSVTFPGKPWSPEYFDSIENFVAGSAVDTVVGSSVANNLRGMAGADRLTGGGGADQLVGGLGNDTFVFTAVSDSVAGARDTIAAGDGAIAFEKAGAALGDRIDLSAIDANTTVAGNQAFLWGTSTAKGHLWAVNSGTTTLIRGNTDNDAAIEIEIAIADAGVTANKYVAADFIL